MNKLTLLCSQSARSSASFALKKKARIRAKLWSFGLQCKPPKIKCLASDNLVLVIKNLNTFNSMDERRVFKRFEDADTGTVYYTRVDVSLGPDADNFEDAVMKIIFTDGRKGWRTQGEGTGHPGPLFSL